MASCSKDIAPVPSPDPDAWMYDETLPVPIRFGASSQPLTKGEAIEGPADMAGKDFGFFAFHDAMTSWGSTTGNTFVDNGISGWSQNMIGECVVSGDKVQFDFDGGPYYYPQISTDNYTFYGYHARTTEVRPSTNSIDVVVEIGHEDILWGKAEAEEFTLGEGVNAVTYEGFNARYIRKSTEEDLDADGNPDGTARHPFMEFKHLTSRLSISAKTEKSQYAENNAGKDQVTITKVSVLNTDVKANLRVAHRTDATAEAVFSKRAHDGKGNIDSGNISVLLTETSQSLCDDFFILPEGENSKVTLQIDFTVDSGEGKTYTTSSVYTLDPEIKADGELKGKHGFFPGLHYKYNFIVYTPERVVIEATVLDYVSAFGDGETEDVYPDNE